MTREEAIAQLKMDRDLFNFNPMTGEEEPMNEDCRKSADALDMAIKALEQEPCEDAVSRQEVVQWLENATDDSIEHAIDSNLEFIPPVIPTPKKGKWIKEETIHGWDGFSYKCSECGFFVSKNALALLKAQEVDEPKQVDLYGKDEWLGFVCVCPYCKAEWMSATDDTHFCPNCGRPVKWE
jgi:predicted RNA-binding Zn-ribbon protein involved in translation (DUF1610 family)